MIPAAILLGIAAIACSPDPGATRDSREAKTADMNAVAKHQGVVMTFDSGGTEARTLIIHSVDEQAFSENARCELARAGFLLIVNVYGPSGSNYRIWELGRD